MQVPVFFSAPLIEVGLVVNVRNDYQQATLNSAINACSRASSLTRTEALWNANSIIKGNCDRGTASHACGHCRWADNYGVDSALHCVQPRSSNLSASSGRSPDQSTMNKESQSGRNILRPERTAQDSLASRCSKLNPVSVTAALFEEP